MKLRLLLGAIGLLGFLLVGPACEEKEGAQPTPTPTVEAKATKPATPPQGTDCDPSYPDVCLKMDAGDYDCAGGSGNGPNYITGPIRVLPPDPFGLDHDHDGWGCE